MDERIFVLARYVVSSFVKGAVIGYLTFLGTQDVLFSFLLGFIYAFYDVLNSVLESDYFKKRLEKHRHGSERGEVYYTSYD